MTRLLTTPWQHTGGFVHNASALHTTPPAPQKPARWTFDLFYKADIFTRHGHGSPGYFGMISDQSMSRWSQSDLFLVRSTITTFATSCSPQTNSRQPGVLFVENLGPVCFEQFPGVIFKALWTTNDFNSGWLHRHFETPCNELMLPGYWRIFCDTQLLTSRRRSARGIGWPISAPCSRICRGGW
jgi:hypothetical protein